jgi:hypothetical protein
VIQKLRLARRRHHRPNNQAAIQKLRLVLRRHHRQKAMKKTDPCKVTRVDRLGEEAPVAKARMRRVESQRCTSVLPLKVLCGLNPASLIPGQWI